MYINSKVLRFLVYGFCLAILVASTFPSSSELDLESSKIRDEVEDFMKLKYGFIPIGSGAACFKSELKYLCFRLRSNEKCSIDQVRMMMKDCAELYLARVNANDVIKKYLEKYPFDYANCDIILSFSEKDYSDILSPFVSSSMLVGGSVYYYVKKQPKDSSILVLEENPQDTFK